MMVLVVTACSAGLRGDLSKWLIELTPGVFVGRPSARIRDLLWERTTELCKDGRALMVHSAANEQRMEFKTHRHHWEPTDFDGITLMRRPAKSKQAPRKTGWSQARRNRNSYKKQKGR